MNEQPDSNPASLMSLEPLKVLGMVIYRLFGRIVCPLFGHGRNWVTEIGNGMDRRTCGRCGRIQVLRWYGYKHPDIFPNGRELWERVCKEAGIDLLIISGERPQNAFQPEAAVSPTQKEP